MEQYSYIKRFAELGADDIALVGGKNASLGEMYRSLSSSGVRVPNGFATTAQAYHDFIRHNELYDKISTALERLDVNDVEALAATGAKIRQWIIRAALPQRLEQELRNAYQELSQEYGPSPDVAVRSSATAEDLPSASFAGQQETYLNIRGTDNLLTACKQVFASLFTNRAISYRTDQGFGHMDIALSVGVQKMARADKGASGVMFTLDTESGFRDVVFITGAYGLGENIVQGQVNPDEFYVFKPTLDKGFRPVIKKNLGEKAIKMIYATDAMAGISTRNIHVSAKQRHRFCLSDDEVLELARSAVTIERHYSKRNGRPTPMDIEWARDGHDNKLYILQARPETVESQKTLPVQTLYHLDEQGKILVQGKSVGAKIATGKVRVVMNTESMHELQPGEILVTDITDPDWEPVMKIAGAIITNRGGRTCHAAIVARELGIPAVIGTGNATSLLQTGEPVTVSCAEGTTGYVYAGQLKYHTTEHKIRYDVTTKTKLMLNIGDPEIAFDLGRLPCDGAGLVRLEFIINNSIGVHPRAILEHDKLDKKTLHTVLQRSTGYASPKEFYISQLAQGIATIAASFFPRPVIVRMSDFKSNEYAALLGGAAFEPAEENPMIGFRGASRYPSTQFSECFALECAALRRARDTMGFSNIKIMLPFVRTVAELKKVLETLRQNGLVRGRDGLEVILMCEIPSNALLADDFLEYCDGFSIGSNDLTQLTLGADRDSGLLSGYDERDPAVCRLMEMAISACRRHGKYVGICGQAPSDFPEITEWLVKHGITSISLNPDSLIAMRDKVVEVEAAVAGQDAPCTPEV